ncbi:MAG: hypothetical protein AAB461_01995 [Patescibacteria group bacterium]
MVGIISAVLVFKVEGPLKDKRFIRYYTGLTPLTEFMLIMAAGIIALPLGNFIHNFPFIELALFIVFIRAELFVLFSLGKFMDESFSKDT